MSAKKIYFVDDDPQALVTISSMAEVLGHSTRSFESGEKFLESMPSLDEGQVFLDVRMKRMDGLETLRRIREKWYAAPIVMISGSSDIPIAVDAMEKGATMFVEKPISLSKLEQVIADSESKTNSNAILRLKQSSRSKLEKLTRREVEVSRLLVGGISNREIADTLDISPRTVEVHRANAMKKLEADSFAEFVKFCVIGAIEDMDPPRDS